jgi:hypothetical protein
MLYGNRYLPLACINEYALSIHMPSGNKCVLFRAELSPSHAGRLK